MTCVTMSSVHVSTMSSALQSATAATNYLLVIFIIVNSARTSQEVGNMRLKKILTTSYDKSQPPVSGVRPLVLSFGLILNEIVLDETKLTLSVHAETSLSWIDGRLAPVTEDSSDLHLFQDDELDKLWKPEIYIWNSRNENSLNAKLRTLTVSKFGKVTFQQKLVTEVLCPNFASHLRPLICSVQFQLHGFVDSEVILDGIKVTIAPDLKVSKYTLLQIETSECTKAGGRSSCQQLSLAFRADINFFATEIYGASFLLVMLSWVGFWIDGTQMFVRLGLGLSIVMILVIYGVGFRVIHSKVGVPGNVEVWVAFCVLFVLASLVEFVFVHVFLRVVPWKAKRLCCSQGAFEQQENNSSFVKAAKVIDVTCGLLFPLIFVLFNIVYWGTY